MRHFTKYTQPEGTFAEKPRKWRDNGCVNLPFHTIRCYGEAHGAIILCHLKLSPLDLCKQVLNLTNVQWFTAWAQSREKRVIW